MIQEDGTPSPALAAYWNGVNTASRLLRRVFEAIREQANADERYDVAVRALIAKGSSLQGPG